MCLSYSEACEIMKELSVSVFIRTLPLRFILGMNTMKGLYETIKRRYLEISVNIYLIVKHCQWPEAPDPETSQCIFFRLI